MGNDTHLLKYTLHSCFCKIQNLWPKIFHREEDGEKEDEEEEEEN